MLWLVYTTAQGGLLHGSCNYVKGDSQVLSDQSVKRFVGGGGVAGIGQRCVAKRNYHSQNDA